MTNKSEKKNIDLQTLADSFGTEISDVKKACEKQLDNMDTGYTVYTGLQR